MNIGIISEFNPFHNGHKFLIEYIKNNFKTASITTVMSSSFVQRGEPALFSKWARTKMALYSGVNLVVELPVIFSCQNAEIFAKNAVKILYNAGVDTLLFGSEYGNVDKLIEISKKINNTDEKFELILKRNLNEGYSFIQSRNIAFLETNTLTRGELNIISEPNNILAIEYIKASMKMNLPLNFISIKRRGSNHDKNITHNSYASGLILREKIRNDESIDNFVPEFTKDIIREEKIYSDDILYSIIKYNSLKNTEDIVNTVEYEDGIENRILNFLDRANTLSELSELVSNKRITKSRVRRILINSLLKIKKEDVISLSNTSPYIRILGFDNDGQKIIKNIQSEKITNFKQYKTKSTSIKKIADYEIAGSNLYSIIRQEHINQDFFNNPIIINR